MKSRIPYIFRRMIFYEFVLENISFLCHNIFAPLRVPPSPWVEYFIALRQVPPVGDIIPSCDAAHSRNKPACETYILGRANKQNLQTKMENPHEKDR